MITYVLPTRNRPEVLRRTLAELERLGDHACCGGAEVIVVDNASEAPVRLGTRLKSGVRVDVLRRRINEGAAARNFGAMHADPASEWIVMLDDDSHPMDLGFVDVLRGMARDVGAVSADIFLGTEAGVITGREQGGLPEVFIGCGVAVRRDLFVGLRGYDHAFNYYAEEYDLAARMMLAGYRVRFEPRFRVMHRKVSAGRDMGMIVARLVRNNGWVIERYAPEGERRAALRAMRRRYRAIAGRERALAGFGAGLVELRRTVRGQTRTPMGTELWRRFTGAAAAREGLAWNLSLRGVRSAALIEEGKNADVIRGVLRELGIGEVSPERAERLVIGTLSPGPMLDAMERRAGEERVVTAWRVDGPEAISRAA
jgi:GT2 family glycosyltransferase